MSKKVLVTLGPSSVNQEAVNSMASMGVDLFRINLSHTKLSDLEGLINKIQSWTDVPICLDSEGAQLRNQDMLNENVIYTKGSSVKIHHNYIVGDEQNISFTPEGSSREFMLGDKINVDFISVCLRVVDEKEGHLLAIVESGGVVGSNKAADIDKEIKLPALTNKDKEAFEIGIKNKVSNFSLSFTNEADDVRQIREITGYDANLISKIESIRGVLNLGDILPLVDQILIDRGDLSRQIPIEKIPLIQRRIISYSNSKDVPVFVATNLLESMIKTNVPTRAEVNDVISTLLMGANGLVLAAETAVGVHPIESVKMVYSLIKQYNRWTPESSFSDIIYS